MILHIPHSSIKIPEGSDINATQQDFNLITDWFTDELFQHKYSERCVFEWSRLFCDVERYRDDNKEDMSKKGHGVVYLNGATGNPIRENLNDAEYIKTNYYDVHHKSLVQKIEKSLSLFPEVVIVDCHSFSDTPLVHENEQELERPDFCIGYNTNCENIFPLQYKISNLLSDNGFIVSINYPFSGSIISDKFVCDERVKTIMIEVNRKLYLTDKYEKSENFYNIKNIISQVLDIVSDYEVECDV